MREILFRGKAINRDNGYHRTNYKNGDWVYGLITRLYDERFETLPAEMKNIDGVSGIEIDHNTIGQYTGLTDKNGNKIFEGDIVKLTFSEVVGKIICDVNYYIESDIFGRTTRKLLSDYISDNLEIIGNIHDNPELLEQEA